MLDILENVPLRPKTTLRIGGNARYYAELKTKKNCEEAHVYAKQKKVPLIILGAGSNTIFADGIIEALVVRTTADNVQILRHAEESPISILRDASSRRYEAPQDDAKELGVSKHFPLP